MIAATYNRDFSGPIKWPVSLRVNSLTKNRIGGCEEATLSARGSFADLYSLAGKLRCPVVIFNAQGDPVWWGFVHSVEIRLGSRVVNASLGSFANKVRVFYTRIAPGQETAKEKGVTGWAEDIDSQGIYGVREKTLTLGEMSDEMATSRRTEALASLKFPALTTTAGSTEGGSASGYIICKGWWNTLAWSYYSQIAGQEAYTDEGQGVTHLGNATNIAVAQSFQVGSVIPWSAEFGSARIRKTGTPPTNITVDLCADSAGVPGTVLATGTILQTSVTTSYLWMAAPFTPKYALSLGTTYWLKLSAAGDANNYYTVDVNTDMGYTSGVFRYYDTQWRTRVPDADMVFKVYGIRETSEQMKDIIASAQFFTGSDILATGLYSNPYRDGNNFMTYYMDDLIKAGTSSGDLIVAETDRERVLRTRHVALAPDPTLFVDQRDRWYRKGNIAIPKETCPVGEWVRVASLPYQQPLIGIFDPGVVFIQRSTYDVEEDVLTFEALESESPFDVVSFQ